MPHMTPEKRSPTTSSTQPRGCAPPEIRTVPNRNRNETEANRKFDGEKFRIERMANRCAYAIPSAPAVRRIVVSSLSSSASAFVSSTRTAPTGAVPRKRRRAAYIARQSTDSPPESASAPASGASADGALVETRKLSPTEVVKQRTAVGEAIPLPRPLPRAPAGTLEYALQGLFREGGPEGTAQALLGGLLSADVQWDNALFSKKSLADLTRELDQLLAFVLEPRIQTTSVPAADEDAGTETLDWILSFVYPLPWRPRVLIAGRTVATRGKSGRFVSIADTWAQPAWTIPRQAWLRMQDLIWLWPSPHAEVDAGVRSLEVREKGYSVVRHARHAEFRMRGRVPPYARYAIWGTPGLPGDAYVGNIRRLEAYDAVSPVCVRNVGEEFEWAVALPGALLGCDVGRLRHPAEGAGYVMVPERRFATKRFRGFATSKVFLKKRDELVRELVKDGLLTEGQGEQAARTWSRCYDCKVGFNVKGMPTLATYGYSQGFPRVNEIAIDLGDNFEDE